MDNNESLNNDGRKFNYLSMHDKAEMLQRLEDKEKTATELADEYGIARSTVSRHKKRSEHIKKSARAIHPNDTSRQRVRKPSQPIIVTQKMLRKQALIYYNEF